jgi:hypothetical protein
MIMGIQVPLGRLQYQKVLTFISEVRPVSNLETITKEVSCQVAQCPFLAIMTILLFYRHYFTVMHD